jgi:hypothetical protein
MNEGANVNQNIVGVTGATIAINLSGIIELYAGTPGNFSGYNDNIWHSPIGVFNGGSSAGSADGALLGTPPYNVGSASFSSGQFNVGDTGAGQLTRIAEAGYWPTDDAAGHWTATNRNNWSNQSSGSTMDGSVTYYFSAPPVPPTGSIITGSLFDPSPTITQATRVINV